MVIIIEEKRNYKLLVTGRIAQFSKYRNNLRKSTLKRVLLCRVHSFLLVKVVDGVKCLRKIQIKHVHLDVFVKVFVS